MESTLGQMKKRAGWNHIRPGTAGGYFKHKTSKFIAKRPMKLVTVHEFLKQLRSGYFLQSAGLWNTYLLPHARPLALAAVHGFPLEGPRLR